jgi:hypothetical protein
MISTAGDFDMTIIMLGRLFFVLSSRLTSTNAPFVQHDRCASREALATLARSHLPLGVGSEAN